MYANPHEPHSCTNLTLDRYIFTYTQLLVEDYFLFGILNQYDRYPESFVTLVKDNMYELNTMGVG